MNKTEQTDKLSLVLHAIEHPEDYSDEQLSFLLRDEQRAAYYRLMCDAASAYASSQEESEEEVEAEWQRFRDQHIQKSLWHKIAAIFIGAILLSGVAYATVSYITRQTSNDRPVASQKTLTEPLHVSAQETNPADTAYTFKDAELQDILSEMATYYELQTLFHNDQARHTRLYIKWDKTEDVQAMVDRLNKFEKVNITLTNDLIIVE